MVSSRDIVDDVGGQNNYSRAWPSFKNVRGQSRVITVSIGKINNILKEKKIKMRQERADIHKYH